MFLAGLKFAFGFVAGLLLICGIVVTTIWAAESILERRGKNKRVRWTAHEIAPEAAERVTPSNSVVRVLLWKYSSAELTKRKTGQIH